MKLILETERLLMRPLKITDVDAFFAMNDNPNVNTYLRNPVRTKAEAEEYVHRIINEYQNNGIGRFAVLLKDVNKLIGFSGLKYRASAENNYRDFYDLGYRFSQSYWRQGFATEAALAWLDYGFNTMKLETIHASAMSDNIGSNTVLKKLGFAFANEYVLNDTMYSWYTFDKLNYNK